MDNQVPGNPTSSPQQRRLLAALLVFTLVIRAGVLLVSPHAFELDVDGYRRLAENIAQHGTFGYGDLPTAYRPPLYPLVIAPLVALGSWSWLAIGLLHVLLGVATVAVVVQVARLWGLERYGLVAGALVAIDPVLVWHSTLVMTETLATFLAVVALWALSAAARRPGTARAALAGGAIGLAALCRPTFLAWMGLAALVLPWFAATWTQRVKLLVVFCAVGAAVLAPWVVRNQIRYGRPIASTTHGGYTLLLGNNRWFYEYLRHGAWGTLWDGEELDRWWRPQAPRGTPEEELRSDELAYRIARDTIRQQPEMFAWSCAIHVGWMWSPLPHRTEAEEGRPKRWLRYGTGIYYTVEFALALVGLAAVLRRGSWRPAWGPWAWVGTWGWGLMLVAIFTGTHALYWSNVRMRAPLMPVVVLAAVAGIAELAGRADRRK